MPNIQNSTLAIMNRVFVGQMAFFAMMQNGTGSFSAPHSGWLWANGSALNNSDYPALADYLQNHYGGNSSQFNVPTTDGDYLICNTEGQKPVDWTDWAQGEISNWFSGTTSNTGWGGSNIISRQYCPDTNGTVDGNDNDRHSVPVKSSWPSFSYEANGNILPNHNHSFGMTVAFGAGAGRVAGWNMACHIFAGFNNYGGSGWQGVEAVRSMTNEEQELMEKTGAPFIALSPMETRKDLEQISETQARAPNGEVFAIKRDPKNPHTFLPQQEDPREVIRRRNAAEKAKAEAQKQMNSKDGLKKWLDNMKAQRAAAGKLMQIANDKMKGIEELSEEDFNALFEKEHELKGFII